MRLSECRPGQGGTVARVDGDGLLGQRLMEMGLIEGAAVKVLRVAPLGDPIEIEIPVEKKTGTLLDTRSIPHA